MSVEAPNSDADLLDLIRIAGPLSVTELADAMEVTATAVRQRLTRLMAQSMIQREAIRGGPGSSQASLLAHRQRLTPNRLELYRFRRDALAGDRPMGDENFGREVLRRISRALAAGYARRSKEYSSRAGAITGRVCSIKADPGGVGMGGQSFHASNTCLPRSESCGSIDQNICQMEKTMFSELIGNEVELTNAA